MVFQLMKIKKITSIPFQKITDQYKELEKKLVLKKKLQEIIALEDTIYDLYLHVAKTSLILFLPKTTLELLKKF
jgi:hypothetical protein